MIVILYLTTICDYFDTNIYSAHFILSMRRARYTSTLPYIFVA
jgi:hypothetical protein